MFWYYKDLDENLAWLTQKTEESKCNKPNFTPPPPLPPPPPPPHTHTHTHTDTVNAIEL